MNKRQGGGEAPGAETRRRGLGDRWRAGVVDLLEMSPDLVFNLPRLTVIGSVHLTLENHQGLVGFAPDRIAVRTTAGEVVILGEDLRIGSLGPRDITMSGRITQVLFSPHPR